MVALFSPSSRPSASRFPLGTAAALALALLTSTTIMTLAKAQSPQRQQRTQPPMVKGSYIAALLIDDSVAAGLAGEEDASNDSKANNRRFDGRAFAAYAGRALGSLALTQPVRYLGELPTTSFTAADQRRQAIVRLDLKGDPATHKAQLDELVKTGVIAYYEPNYLSKPYSRTSSLNGATANETFGDVLPRYRDYLQSDCGGDGTECHQRYTQIGMVSALNTIKETPLSQAPVIAVMDSGVDYQHPALADKLWQNSARQSGVSGCDNDIYGCDTTQSSQGSLGQGRSIYPTGTDGPGQTCPPISQQGGNCIHGTHIAGIIAATTNQVDGYAYPGVCPSCKVLSVKIVGPTQDGTNTGVYSIADSSIIAGLTYIANFSSRVQPVKVVNASFGKFHASRTVEALLRKLQSQGILFVAATGNESTDKPSYPAAFEGVIAVANISKRTRAKHENSNYGTWVDISAPGSGSSGIYSTMPGGNFIPLIGTSMAAPMVAAVAGLVWAQNPGLSPDAVAARILDGADQSLYEVSENTPYLLKSDGMVQTLMGRGSLNAANAVGGISGNSLYPTSRRIPAACGTVHIGAAGGQNLWWLLYLLPLLALVGPRCYPGGWFKPR